MKGSVFLGYTETRLCSALQPGDIVVAGNLHCRKVRGVRAAIQPTGVTPRPVINKPQKLIDLAFFVLSLGIPVARDH